MSCVDSECESSGRLTFQTYSSIVSVTYFFASHFVINVFRKVGTL